MINTRYHAYFQALNANTSWKADRQVQGLPEAPVNTAAPDTFFASPELAAAGPSGPQVLQQFGGDRLKLVQKALAASGGKAPQNPEVPWYGKLLMPFIGDKRKTVSKDFGPDQTVTTKFKVKKFKLDNVRLTTREGLTLRHVDFPNTRPSTGKRGQVKDVGEIIAKGQPTRMFTQEVRRPQNGQQGEIKNTYFDPKTGQPFLKTLERSNQQGEDKFQTVKSLKGKQTYREIDVLGGNGQVTGRYVFDYGQKQQFHQAFDEQGKLTRTTRLPKKADYFKTVDLLSKQPPSSAAPAPQVAVPQPALA